MTDFGTKKEYTVERHLVKRVEAIGGMALKGDVPGRRFLDRIVILPGGRTVYVECKRPRGRFSAHQRITIDRLRAMGHEVWTVSTTGEIDEHLQQVVSA